MDVLVIGYGKIGRIKAFIWRELGRKVWVHDVSKLKLEEARMDGFELYGSDCDFHDLIVDISTPASFHLQSLRWILDRHNIEPRSILVEKPLASDLAELKAMRDLLRKPGLEEFRSSIVVNESYYLSSALHHVAKDIKKRKLRIREIEAELSKDRLEDVANGRFVDSNLGSLGIELPHMVAMVQILDVKLAELDALEVLVYAKDDVMHNEGFTARIATGDTPIIFKSYLGDFRVKNGFTQPNKMIRSLEVSTDEIDYYVTFDPAPGLKRYQARVATYNQATGESEVKIFDDNHLAANLKKIHLNEKNDTVDTYLVVENSFGITDFIFNLKAKSVTKSPPLGLAGKAIQSHPSKQHELEEITA